ncbi:hypothetical protein FPV67DRAFT_911651 [Lyophyllum atratum]|nr:hypothetical protein FPV67DRAFT_911651 [Lyophyllum atratum]
MSTDVPRTSILMTGATGYIGGSVLCRFLERKDFKSLDINAIVRTRGKAEQLNSLGIFTVIGSHSAYDFVSGLASTADVVFSMADADDTKAAAGILDGLKKKYEATGKPPVLIHTSGTGVIADNACGEYASDTIYDDMNPDQIESLPPTQLHRPVDLMIINADKEGYIRSYIIAPSTIYGVVNNRLVEMGVQNPHSIQIPALIDASLDRGQGGMVGPGKNIWPNVSNDDIADLFLVLYDSIMTNPSGTGHGREGFYFGENGEHSLYEVGKAIAELLVEIGRGVSAEPTPFTKEEIDKYFAGSYYLGSNARCRANRARSIGWIPKKPKSSMFASIAPEISAAMTGERKAAVLR